jgi:hypothetical protein
MGRWRKLLVCYLVCWALVAHAEPCPTLTLDDIALYTRWGHDQSPRLEFKDCADECIATRPGKGIRVCLFHDPDGRERYHGCNGRARGPACH